MKVSKVKLTPAKCAADLSNGSERGQYVDADYILRKLHRPHRAVNIMYCYYPLDEAWPKRASKAYPDMDISFAWDYPYDDYFPYLGGWEGSTDGEPFTCMRDIRRHGQDVILTLTCDPHVSDEQITAIAKDLRPFGRMMLRLNHECTGNWFSFTKRASYKELGDFFVRFKKILSEYAPNVKVILCAGASISKDDPSLEMEQEFMEAGRVADIWSVDKYIALNWGWPYEIAEKDNSQHKLDSPEFTYEMTKLTFERYKKLYGEARPMVMSELNVDGDVTGPYRQVDIMMRFFDLIRNDPERWFSGFCFYQFRDDGRLGLEITDPNNPSVGIEQPMLAAYRDLISDDFFKPGMMYLGEAKLPVSLRWGGSEDAEGLSFELGLKDRPVYAEAYFEGESIEANLMIEVNGRWYYKAPGVKCIDFIDAFENGITGDPSSVKMNIFAPPASGENDPSQGDGWDTDYYYTLKELPALRLRYEPVLDL